MLEDFPVQHNGIFKDRFVAPNVGCCFGVFDRQRSDLAGALARAVCDEPNFKYMIPNEQARVRFQTAFFGIVGGAGQLRGEDWSERRHVGQLSPGGFWDGPSRVDR